VKGKRKWRLYADENIDAATVKSLRNSGFDVLYVPEDNALCKQEDSLHYARARQLSRYLLTKDNDFWSDKDFPLHESPGLILLSGNTKEPMTAWLLRLLRKLVVDYNPLDEPIYLDQVKVRISEEGITIHVLDKDTQTKTTDTWMWRELY